MSCDAVCADLVKGVIEVARVGVGVGTQTVQDACMLPGAIDTSKELLCKLDKGTCREQAVRAGLSKTGHIPYKS